MEGSIFSETSIDAAALTFRFIVAFVFLYAAIPKLANRPEFSRAVTNYRLVPKRLVGLVATGLPILEVCCAAASFAGIAVPATALITATLLAVFTIAVAWNLLRGREIDCGCAGSVTPRQISWSLVVGDLMLAGLAVFAGFFSPKVLCISYLALGRETTFSSSEAVAFLRRWSRRRDAAAPIGGAVGRPCVGLG